LNYNLGSYDNLPTQEKFNTWWSLRVTVHLDLSMRNTFWKIHLLLVLPYLCIWKLLKSLYHFRNHLHYHAHCLVRELLLAWEDSCKHFTVIVKVMDIRNITWMVDFAFIPVGIKYMLFVCKDTPDVQLLTELWGGYSFFHTYMPNSGKYSSQGIYLIGNEHYMNLYLCLCYYKL
jgi:hypothetical protein